MGTAKNINLTKIVTFLDLHVNYVSSKGQNKSTMALFQEVCALNLVSFIIYVLILRNKTRLKEWAQPSDNVVTLMVEELDRLIGTLVDIELDT
jgi:hypothetical protein